MKTNHFMLTGLMAGLTWHCACHAQVDERMAQTNPHWHLVSCSFSDLFGLMPTNVPVRYFLLNNGQWAWTTNRFVQWQGGGIDYAGLEQSMLQQRRRMDEADPPGIARVIEYHARGRDEKHC
jgi:hypothetical protein